MSVSTLTGHVNGNGNAIELSNPFCGCWSADDVVDIIDVDGALLLIDVCRSTISAVITSPNVHGDVVSIFTWYSFRQTRNLGRHTPSQFVFDPLTKPLQHLPKSSLPASLLNDWNRNSNTPDDLAYNRRDNKKNGLWFCCHHHYCVIMMIYYFYICI